MGGDTKKRWQVLSSLTVVIAALTLLQACWATEKGISLSVGPVKLEVGQRMITILQTNDIHGGVEPVLKKDGTLTGGMAIWSGIVRAIREGIRQQYGDRAGVLVVDAGDQFQGTLISNYNEGQLVINLMDQVGYDAVIPGNHDYDFGPKGWLEDHVTSTSQDQNPRGALLRALKNAQFPLISANTFYKNSIVDDKGNPVRVEGVGCKPMINQSPTPGLIDFSRARRPEFLTPYVIKTVAGLRVALIGIDNPDTPEITTVDNVSDLCFRDEAATYMDIRRELEGIADVFVAIVHDGNSSTDYHATDLAKKLTTSGKGRMVDAIVAGHTHFLNKLVVNGVPVIQSRSGGQMFGRIDLIWDSNTKQIVVDRGRNFAGMAMPYSGCTESAPDFCKTDGSGHPSYEGIQVVPDSKISDMIDQAKKEVAPLADLKLGSADSELKVDRIQESPLMNAMTDTLRDIAKQRFAASLKGADVIGMINTGGLRASIKPGEFTYNDLFLVSPFNNHMVLAGPMDVTKFISAIKRSIDTCGDHGSLMPSSGVHVTFERDCENSASRHAVLRTVQMENGQMIYDSSRGAGNEIAVPANTNFWIATLDFIGQGGSGYVEFLGVPLTQSPDDFTFIFREALKDYYLAHPAHFQAQTDGRWKELPFSAP